jgi:flagellum-specific ATP synthase
MHNVVTPRHYELSRRYRQAYSRYQKSRDLIQLGAYVAGSDPETDRAIMLFPALQKFLMQDMREQAPFNDSVAYLAKALGEDAEPASTTQRGSARATAGQGGDRR